MCCLFQIMTETGWGVKRESSFSTVNILLKQTLPVMTNSGCKRLYSKGSILGNLIKDGNICDVNSSL